MRGKWGEQFSEPRLPAFAPPGASCPGAAGLLPAVAHLLTTGTGFWIKETFAKWRPKWK